MELPLKGNHIKRCPQRNAGLTLGHRGTGKFSFTHGWPEYWWCLWSLRNGAVGISTRRPTGKGVNVKAFYKIPSFQRLFGFYISVHEICPGFICCFCAGVKLLP